jgi:hypothetical protein
MEVSAQRFGPNLEVQVVFVPKVEHMAGGKVCIVISRLPATPEER